MFINNIKGADLIYYHILFQSWDRLLIPEWTQYCFYTSSDLSVYYFQLYCSLSHKFEAMELTTWSWGLLEKPPVTQLFKNFWTFYGTQRFITVFTRAHHWSLSWARWKGIKFYIKMLKLNVTTELMIYSCARHNFCKLVHNFQCTKHLYQIWYSYSGVSGMHIRWRTGSIHFMLLL
jgi:hypothetical protein